MISKFFEILNLNPFIRNIFFFMNQSRKTSSHAYLLELLSERQKLICYSVNFTVEVRGVQYDRLALMYFNDTEVWRTSTAEPTQNGIEWTYVKDMSHYLYFWKSPQKLIFDLGNIYDSTCKLSNLHRDSSPYIRSRTVLFGG